MVETQTAMTPPKDTSFCNTRTSYWHASTPSSALPGRNPFDDDWISKHRSEPENLQDQKSALVVIIYHQAPRLVDSTSSDFSFLGAIEERFNFPYGSIPATEHGSLEIFETSELTEALQDLKEIERDAVEENFRKPSKLAQENASRILRDMYQVHPCRFEVYSMPDGEIAIDARGGFGKSVVLLCESEGSALCLVNIDGSHRRARYSETAKLPDGFIKEALAELR